MSGPYRQCDLFGRLGDPTADFVMFEATLLERTDPTSREPWDDPHVVNAVLIDLFGTRETLTIGQMFESFVPTVAPWVGTTARASWLGVVIARAVSWDIVASVSDADEPTWRLLDRRPRYRMIGRAVVQVRGLPPDHQAVMDRRIAALESREARADRRHAERLSAHLMALLSWLGEAEASIPAAWHRYVPADIARRWPRIHDARGLLAGLHLDWPRRKQLAWQAVVESEVPPQVLAQIRQGVTPARASEPVEMSEEDLAALHALG